MLAGNGRVNDSPGKDSRFLKLSYPAPGTAAPTVCCDLLAHGAVRATPEAMPGLRLRPGSGIGERLPASLLKNADEQSVVALASVLQAIDQHGLAGKSFSDWGVLACPRFIGRIALAGSIQRYANEGPWGISPHVIPHRLLHATSGTISQALKIHGPNFGVGGGPRGASELFLSAAAMLGTRPLPGVWVVLTGWDPEPIPDGQGRSTTSCVCAAVALALVPARPDWRGLRLVLSPATKHDADGNSALSLSLEGLQGALAGGDACLASARWRLEYGGWVRFERARGGAGLPVPHLFRHRDGVHGQSTRHGPGSMP